MRVKRNKLGLVLSLLVIWIPVVIELSIWSKLPNKFPIHYNSQMIADGWSSKVTGIFLLPIILTVAQLAIDFLIVRDPNNNDLPKWVSGVLLAIMPVVAIILSGMGLATALGVKLQDYRTFLMELPVGLMMVMIGLVLKRVGPNRTIGIRLPWTLQSQRNWDLTHQFGAKLFMIGGILLIICGLLKIQGMFLFIVLTVIILPCVYSYVLHRRGI